LFDGDRFASRADFMERPLQSLVRDMSPPQASNSKEKDQDEKPDEAALHPSKARRKRAVGGFSCGCHNRI